MTHRHVSLRNATIVTLLGVAVVYHGTGLHFIYWQDSGGYLAQASSLVGPGPLQRSGGRSIGYPLFLALPALLPATALIVTLLQAALAVLAYRLIWGHVTRAAPTLAPRQIALRNGLIAGLPLALAVSASYSALQTFILSLLPEILFAVLALAGVVAVSRFVYDEDGNTPGLWWRAAAAAALASVAMLVKPHWLLAAPILVFIVAVKLAAVTWRPGSSRLRMAGRMAAAAVLPLAVYAAVGWPERHLSATVNPAAALFGPRTLFCNHAHMIADARLRHPSFRLHADPAIDAAVMGVIGEIRARDTQPWKHLGFNGDLCLTDARLSQELDRLLPSIEAQRGFLIGAYAGAMRAEPLRFSALIVRQMVLGLEVAFLRFSKHTAFDQASFAQTAEQLNLRPSFLFGTTQTGDVGPLGAKERLKSTIIGWAVLIALSLIFIPLTVVYMALVAVSLIAAPLRWRAWNLARRRACLAYIGVPVAAILAHNLLISVAHTFDIWRYGFNLFFVNLLLIATAGLFWLEEGLPWLAAQRLRAAAKGSGTDRPE